MKELLNSLKVFRSKIGDIPKNAKGYGYKYADLQNIWLAIEPILDECNLVVNQSFVPDVENNNFGINTTIYHTETEQMLDCGTIYAPKDGESKSKMSPVQAIGSEITYLRRYSLAVALNLTTDEDNDGALQKKVVAKKQESKIDSSKEAEHIQDIAMVSDLDTLKIAKENLTRNNEMTAKVKDALMSKYKELNNGK